MTKMARLLPAARRVSEQSSKPHMEVGSVPGNQGVHGEIGLDVGERLPPVGKRADIMLVRFQQTGNEFQDGGARINQNDAHPIIQPLLHNGWL